MSKEDSMRGKSNSGRGSGRGGGGYASGRGGSHSGSRGGYTRSGRGAGGARGSRQQYYQSDRLNSNETDVEAQQYGTASKRSIAAHFFENTWDQPLTLKNPSTPTKDLVETGFLARLVRGNVFGSCRHNLRLQKCPCGKQKTYLCTNCTNTYCTLECSKMEAAPVSPQSGQLGLAPPTEESRSEQTEFGQLTACSQGDDVSPDGERHLPQTALLIPKSETLRILDELAPKLLAVGHGNSSPLGEAQSNGPAAISSFVLATMGGTAVIAPTKVISSKSQSIASSSEVPMTTGGNVDLLVPKMSNTSLGGLDLGDGAGAEACVGRGRGRGKPHFEGVGNGAGLGRGVGRGRGMPHSKFGLFHITYPAKESTKLEIGTDMPVMVSHVESPSDFYVSLVADLPKLEVIGKEIEIMECRELQGENPWELLSFPKAADLCVAKYGGGEKLGAALYRARVTENLPDSSTVQVQLIDFGVIFDHSHSQLKRLPAGLAEIPGLANRVVLHGLLPKAPDSDGKWPKEAMCYFMEMVDEVKCSFRATSKTGGSYDGTLMIGGKDIGKEIVKSGFAKFSDGTFVA